jgi:hypothetical protein
MSTGLKFASTFTEAVAPPGVEVRMAKVIATHEATGLIDVRPVGSGSTYEDVQVEGGFPDEGDVVMLERRKGGVYVALTSAPASSGGGSGGGVTLASVTNVTQNITTPDTSGGQYVPITRQLIAGDGIQTIGDLSANRTIAVDSTVLRTGSTAFVPPTRQVIAGNGLTGGGTLASDVTLTVGAGTGIGVTADAVYVDFGDGLGAQSNKVVLGTPGNISIASTNSVAPATHTHAVVSSSSPGAAASLVATDASGHVTLEGVSAIRLAVNRSIATATAAAGYVRSSTLPQLRLEYDDANYFDLAVDSAGSFKLAPTGDLILNPGGKDVLPQTSYDINLGSTIKKFLTLHVAEFWADVLVAQKKLATIGGKIGVAPTTTLTRDLAAGASNYLTVTQRGAWTTATGAGGGGQQTITARGSATTGATDTAASVTVNKPTGVVDNDVMLAFVSWWTGTLTPPAGWTQVGTTESWAASGDTAKMAVYRKVASGEGASYTWTNSSSPNEIYVTIRAFYNVDTTTPIDVFSQTSTTSQGTSVVGNSVTTTTTNTMLLFFGSRMNNGINGNPITPDGSMTEISDINAGSGWTRHFVDEQAVAASGATGTRTATSTGNATYGAFMIALRAATGGGNTSVSPGETFRHRQ